MLHNLTFQLEAEAPTLFSRMSALGRVTSTPEGDTGPIGCFSPQSSKVLEAEVRREGGEEARWGQEEEEEEAEEGGGRRRGKRATGREERTEGKRESKGRRLK